MGLDGNNNLYVVYGSVGYVYQWSNYGTTQAYATQMPFPNSITLTATMALFIARPPNGMMYLGKQISQNKEKIQLICTKGTKCNWIDR